MLRLRASRVSGRDRARAASVGAGRPLCEGCDSLRVSGASLASGPRRRLGTPGYVKQIVATDRRPWTHWRKAPLLTRDGSPPLDVSIAEGWRNRVGISWGDSPIASALQVRSCPPLVGSASGWTGGFYLRSRTACIPLIFRIGLRSETVYFGLGRRCPNLP